VAGATPSGWNGTFRITAVPTTTTFRVAMATNPGAYVSGAYSCIEPDAQFQPSMPAVPALIIQNHPQSVPLGLDSGLPVLGVCNGRWGNASWGVCADGHSVLVAAGGLWKQFSNGFADQWSSDHALGWTGLTSGVGYDPQTAANLDTGIKRNAAGVVEINNGTAGTFRDLRIRALNIGGVQVVGAQGAAVADATDAASVITQLYALLARLRTHGLIAP
jgi:hypothetical protein